MAPGKRATKAPDPDLLQQFDLGKARYLQFRGRLQDLVSVLLQQRGIAVHSVTSRVKQRSSLQRKLQKPGAQYRALADVTDLVGVRITTYFSDHVDAVAEILEAEFLIDAANSVDKRAALAPDRFGYLSLHHVVGLSQQRCALPEYAPFTGLKAEIQTRSILQHAWAEIEHDLGYKSQADVPRTLRRRFSQLAGVLELADQEFQRIRDDLQAYRKTLPARILNAPEGVAFDKESLQAFVDLNMASRTIDERIADALSTKLERFTDHSATLRRLRALRLTNFRKIESALLKYEDGIVRLARVFLSEPPNKAGDPIRTGASLFYLCYLVAANRGEEKVETMLRSAGVGDLSARIAKHVVRHLGTSTES